MTNTRVLARTTAERQGKRLTDDDVVVFHIRDGEIAEISEYPGDLHAAEEFWS